MERVCIEPGLLLLVSLSLLLLPIQWVAAAWLAAAWHELFHMAALRILGSRILRVNIGLRGCTMRIPAMPPGKECVCALAGPAGSMLLLVFMRLWPELAVCGFIQGSFNLLPIFPLDGGRALRCLFSLISPKHGSFFCFAIELLCCLCLTAWLARFGLVPFVMGCMALFRAVFRKISCKAGLSAVQ